MAREPEDLELDGDITITCQPLKYERAEDLLPDIVALAGLAATHGGAAIAGITSESLKKIDVASLAASLGPLLVTLADKLGQGKLKQLAPLLLNATAIVYPDDSGKKTRADLSKAVDRAAAFEAHPELYFIALGFATKVTFAKFFPAIGPLVLKMKSLMMKDPSHPQTEVTP